MAFSINGIPIGRSFLKARRHKFGLPSLIMMMVIGASMLGVFMLIFTSTQIDDSWVRVEGKVVDSKMKRGSKSTTYSSIVEYTVDGTAYRVTSNMGSSSMPSIGSAEEVAYNPSNIADAKVVSDGAPGVFWLFPAIGVIMIIAAPIFFVRGLMRDRAIRRLKRTGTKLEGVLVDIKRANSNSSRLVVAAVDTSGSSKTYVSDAVTGAVGLTLSDFQNTAIPIDVYVDPTNPDNYYVDLSDIPELTPESIKQLVQKAVSGQSVAQQPNIVAAVPPAPAIPAPATPSGQVVTPQPPIAPSPGQPIDPGSDSAAS